MYAEAYTGSNCNLFILGSKTVIMTPLIVLWHLDNHVTMGHSKVTLLEAHSCTFVITARVFGRGVHMFIALRY